MATFGKRGIEATRPVARSGPILGPHDPITRESSDVVSDVPRPTFHGSHLELHWPKYAAAAFASFALVATLSTSKADPVTLLLVVGLAYAVGFFALNGFRKGVTAVHTVRTQLFRSKPFLLGAGLGLAFYAFSTFVSPTAILGFPIGGDNFLADGFQQQDFASLASMILGCAGLMAAGGVAFEFVAKLFRGKDQEETK